MEVQGRKANGRDAEPPRSCLVFDGTVVAHIPHCLAVASFPSISLFLSHLFRPACTVCFHPRGFQFPPMQLRGDFLVYFERLRSSNGPVYLLDSSVVHPLPTILFADDLALVHRGRLIGRGEERWRFKGVGAYGGMERER